MKRQLTQQNRIAANGQTRIEASRFVVALGSGLGWASFTAFTECPGTSSVICPTHKSGAAGMMFDSKWLQGETGRTDVRPDYRPESLNLDL